MSLPGYDPNCEICMYAAETGSWPVTHRGTHCGDDGCHRSWTASKEAHCMGTEADGTPCHKHFSADSVADRHRRGGYCMTREEMLIARSKTGAKVLRVVDTPKGELWRGAETLHLRPAFVKAPT